jgi:hypothetical protein
MNVIDSLHRLPRRRKIAVVIGLIILGAAAFVWNQNRLRTAERLLVGVWTDSRDSRLCLMLIDQRAQFWRGNQSTLSNSWRYRRGELILESRQPFPPTDWSELRNSWRILLGGRTFAKVSLQVVDADTIQIDGVRLYRREDILEASAPPARMALPFPGPAVETPN